MNIETSGEKQPGSKRRSAATRSFLGRTVASIRRLRRAAGCRCRHLKQRHAGTVVAITTVLAVILCSAGVFSTGLNLGAWSGKVFLPQLTRWWAVGNDLNRAADFTSISDQVARMTRAQNLRGRSYEILDLPAATLRVHESTTHSNERLVGLDENWLQFGLGLLYEPLSRTQDSDRLLEGGAANCSERCAILKVICEAAGYRCRYAGLEGHVVLEVRWRGRWHTADPDYGVVFAAGVHDLADPKCEKLITSRLAERGYSQATIQNYLSILQSTENNRILAEGVELSPRLIRIEQICKWAIWILPLMLLAGGGWLLRTSRFAPRFPFMRLAGTQSSR